MASDQVGPEVIMAALTAYLGPLESYLREYGISVLFLSVFLEAAGLPMPGETALISASVMAASGEFHLVSVVVAGVTGAVLGDNLGYLIGSRFGRSAVLRYGRGFGIRADHMARAERAIARCGALLIVVARFLPVLRQIASLGAGTAHMPWAHFVAANAVGAVLWVLFWVGLVGGLGRTMPELLARWSGSAGHVLLVVLCGVLFVVLAALVVRGLLRAGGG